MKNTPPQGPERAPQPTGPSKPPAPLPPPDLRTPRTPGAGWEQVAEHLKRPFTVEDVKMFQDAMQTWNEWNEEGGTNFALGSSEFYEFTTSGWFSKNAVPKNRYARAKEMLDEREDPKAYESFYLETYRAWKANMASHADRVRKERPRVAAAMEALRDIPDPTTREEFYDLLRSHQELNDLGPISFQDGLGPRGQIANPFVHVKSHRLEAYAHELPETQVRIYVDPPKEAVPKLAELVVKLAGERGVPFYFKMIDFSLQKAAIEDSVRRDRFLFYTDKKTAPAIMEILDEIKKAHPEWFEGRPLPVMTASVSEGIGIGEDPTPAQDAKFGSLRDKKTSFSDLRAKLLKDAWRDAFAQLIKELPDKKPRGGRTLSRHLKDAVEESTKGFPAHVAEITRADYDLAKVKDGWAKSKLENAILKVASLTAPFATPDSLLQVLEPHLRANAKIYGIDPENLALNA
jgi:hypothetical protein